MAGTTPMVTQLQGSPSHVQLSSVREEQEKPVTYTIQELENPNAATVEGLPLYEAEQAKNLKGHGDVTPSKQNSATAMLAGSSSIGQAVTIAFKAPLAMMAFIRQEMCCSHRNSSESAPIIGH